MRLVFIGVTIKILFRCNPNDILDKPSVITSESIKQFISQAIDQTREETMMIIKKDLIKIADAGEYEDLRREVEYYFK